MHQNRASPFASDFYRRRGYRREFRSKDHFYPFSSQKKSRFAGGFLRTVRRGSRASWGLKKSRDFSGSGKIAAATTENRAILVHSDGGHLKPVTLKPVICIFCIFHIFVFAFSAFSAFLLFGIFSDPCFFCGERDFPYFPHFPRIGFESLISRSDQPTLL